MMRKSTKQRKSAEVRCELSENVFFMPKAGKRCRKYGMSERCTVDRRPNRSE
jgi:hypothetical protein